jgi:transposase
MYKESGQVGILDEMYFFGKGVFMNSLGIDVSKAKLDCCLLREDKARKTKVVANNAVGFAALLAWCARQGAPSQQSHAVVEGTGCYHQAVVRALHEAGMRVYVANPARARQFALSQGLLTKNDSIDAFALARFVQTTELHPWQPPPPEAEHLQALTARREALAQDLQREKNRLENGDIAHWPPCILASIKKHIRFLEKELARLDDDIDRFIRETPRLREADALLRSIPGVGPRTSTAMLCVLLCNRFDSAEQVAAYLGLIPVEKQSGSSVRGRSRLSKNGPAKVRATLYMAAVSAKTYNPHIKAMSERLLRRGKHAMSIIGAAMRKLVHLCFGVLKNHIPYQNDFLKTS